MNQADQQDPQAQPAAPAATTKAETIEVKDLDTFVKLLTRWHANKVKQLEHFLKLEEDPDGGIEMQVGEEESFKLEGDILKGMKAGINLALMEFGNLPFGYEVEGGADAPAAQPANAG